MLCGDPADLAPLPAFSVILSVQNQEHRKCVAKPTPVSHLLIPGAALSSEESIVSPSLPTAV